jgi:NodT family efflux transporter outer membrane factor (OMF) lipoprotein
MNPQYQRPDNKSFTGKTFTQSKSASFQKDLDVIQWWRRFDDATLNKLVEQALKNNIDLRIASANILESEALIRSARGVRLPQLNTATSSDRSFTGANTGSIFIGGARRSYFTTNQLAGEVSWQADLFGRLRSIQQAATADWQATKTDHIALTHTVIADVIRQRAELAIAIRRLYIAQDILTARERTLEIVTRRYESGLNNTSAVDIRLARENVFSATANIAALEESLSLTQHALDILLGTRPGALFISDSELINLPELDDSIIGVPSQLLDRRPDIRAAEFRTIAANARVGVALADLFPDLTITGSLGWRDNEPSGLFNPNTLFGNIFGQLAHATYTGGQRSAEADAAQARLEAAAHTYSGIVLQAIREVEDALIQNQKLSKRYIKLKQRALEARQAERTSLDRYVRGVEDLLIVLETERRRQDAEVELLDVELNYWNARINLFLAIGGDWLSNDDYLSAKNKQ